ncbi:DUF2255 family protein [Cellulomonas sp. Marseille-Q8402]
MTSWTSSELERIGAATELRLASRRADGSLRPFVTMWVARTGDGIYVRSMNGVDNPWFRHAVSAGRGRLSAGGVERDVRLEQPEPDVHAALDAALHTKYDRYGPGPVGSITGPDRYDATLRLVPESADS